MPPPKSICQGIAILGSTGSIGTQTIHVLQRYSQHFKIKLLTAHTQSDLLIKQAKTCQPAAVLLSHPIAYKHAKQALKHSKIKVYDNNEWQEALTTPGIDKVLVALVGIAGLKPTLLALQAKKDIALANKETLVIAGQIITEYARKQACHIYPVDSEHAGLFQCLLGENKEHVSQLILTASGGPFRGKSKQQLKDITPQQALRHPNWTMGKKVSIDSATLMNKGLEVIEARWLFGIKGEQIDVVVHPESIVHAMVAFCDGSIKAQIATQDMRIPILYALSYPRRLALPDLTLKWDKTPLLRFEAPDRTTFPALDLCYKALNKAGNAPCVLNALNEVAVKAFLSEKISFLAISDLIAEGLQHLKYLKQPSYEDLTASDKTARQWAKDRLVMAKKYI